MPFIKISGLTTATAVSATNQFEINQNGGSRSATLAQVAAFARTSATDPVVLPAGTVSAPALTFTGDTNTGIYSPAADTIAFTEGGVEAMRLDASGNLLLGVTTTGSPGISLSSAYNIGWTQSAGESVPNVFRQASSAATVMANGYRFTATANGFASSFSSSYAKTAISCGTASGAITFYTDPASAVAAGTDVTPSERMRITAAGDVGIGTSSPGERLTVNSAIGIRGSNFSSLSYFGSSVNTTGVYTGLDSAGGYVINVRDAGYQAFSTSNAERMRITAAGNVGIGTNSPAGRLHARFDAGAGDGFTGRYIFQTTDQRLTIGTYWEAGVGQYSRIQSSNDAGGPTNLLLQPDGGLIGIGVTAPNFKLQLHQSLSPVNYLQITNSSSGSGVGDGMLVGTDSAADAIVWMQENTNLKFATNNTERMRIDSAGNVGIGTSNPAGYRLRVVGASGSAQFRAGTDASGYLEVNAFDANPVYCVVSGSNHTAGVFGTQSNTPTIFFTNNTERARIDASGNLSLGNTAGGARLRVTGGVVSAPVLGNVTNYPVFISNTDIAYGLGIGTNFATGHVWLQAQRADGAAVAYNMTLNEAGGNVGIGTASPTARLDVVSADSPEISVRSTQSGSWKSRIAFGNAARKWEIGSDISGVGNNNLYFYDAAVGAERVRIDNSGNFFVGRTTISGFTNEVGLWFSPNQGISIGKNSSANMGACLYMNRMAAIGDGNLVEFAESGTLEGTISISGTTVSYNGGHLSRWSQLPTQQRDPALLKGTVLSNLDEMCEWLDDEGNPLPNEQLNRMKISDVEGDTNVAGVFVNWDNDDQVNPYDMNIAMTGDMIIRIAAGVAVQKGMLLMSAGDGTAKPQGDDIVRSKTIAKVTSNHVTCTYPDGSYCVPCVLMAC